MVQGNVIVPQKKDPRIINLFSRSEIPEEKIESYIKEIESNISIRQSHQRMSDVNGIHELQVPVRCVGLYILVRYYQPETVVETGSYFGHSSTYILSAMSENNLGKFHSFDVHPNKVGWYPELPQDFELGYMIPEKLKERWKLHRGDTHETLQNGLEEIGEIDLFFHDSNHEESHKRFEFKTAKQHITSGGIIASHDVGHGNASDGSPPSYAFIDIANEFDAAVHSDRDFEPGDDGPRVFAFFQANNN